jgi:hypothetical protein
MWSTIYLGTFRSGGEGDTDYKPIMRRAIELGGHIKTGLELHYSPNRNPTNLELLEEP